VTEATESTSGQADNKKDTEEAQIPSKAAIDPATVSIEDIKRYEALMKGKAVSAISNAQTLRGATQSEDGRPSFYRRHNWTANGEDEFGPMEISFESAANLISLNVDLTFSCKDSSELLREGEAPKEEPSSQSSHVADDGVVVVKCASE